MAKSIFAKILAFKMLKIEAKNNLIEGFQIFK